jgi:hypothetical protein
MMRLQKLAIIPDLLSSVDPTVDLIIQLPDQSVVKPDRMLDPAEVCLTPSSDSR